MTSMQHIQRVVLACLIVALPGLASAGPLKAVGKAVAKVGTSVARCPVASAPGKLVVAVAKGVGKGVVAIAKAAY